jgi:putative redox protein
MTSTVEYQGDLRTTCLHIKSGQIIVTDAPTDNQGRGEAFSPTDLLATSLGACMLTIMGISANRHGIALAGTKVEITKVMAENPRRVSQIIAAVVFPVTLKLQDKEKNILENAARQCPVAKSLHPDIDQQISFTYF